MREPHLRPDTGAPRAERTYVVWRDDRSPFGRDRPDQITPLGTVRAPSFEAARVRARTGWPHEWAGGLRVMRASACRPTLLLGALAADGERLLHERS